MIIFDLQKKIFHLFRGLFRDSVIAKLTEGPQLEIGGDNLNVEIDETLINHHKYNRGRCLASFWYSEGYVVNPLSICNCCS